MSFEAKILADSVSPDNIRLTTFEVTIPRIVLAELNTHKMISKNSASSRAIPVEKMIERVMSDPYMPSSWGKNQNGMQAEQAVDASTADLANYTWLKARDSAVAFAEQLRGLGIHKQTTNRLLEPFMWHTCILSGTEWSNFFHLRNNAQAHPDIQIPARMMQQLYESSEPKKLSYGAWHTPLVSEEDVEEVARLDGGNEGLKAGWHERRWAKLVKISVARCARVSYLTHDGQRSLDADIELYDRLLSSGHLSPFEHVARPARPAVNEPGEMRLVKEEGAIVGVTDSWFGNLRGWVQYRKMIPHEADILAAR